MRDRPAKVADVHRIAAGMPHVKRIEGPKGNTIYQVGGKSFVFFRTPQPDAEDPETGERWADVIMIWVESESDKLALLQDPARRRAIGEAAAADVNRRFCESVIVPKYEQYYDDVLAGRAG